MKSSLPAFPWGYASLSKAGAAEEENEDAIAVSLPGHSLAIADGATEGWQSGKWARRLAMTYNRRPPNPTSFAPWLARLQDLWNSQKPEITASWYAEAKREQGSFATLLGLHFDSLKQSQRITWKAMAVGDSCLLIVRNEELLTCWPVESLAGFGNRPALLPSSKTARIPEPEWLAGRCEPGDIFILATDAGAAGLLQLKSAGLWRSMSQILNRPTDSERTAALLELAKECQRLRNDDVTFLAVAVPPPRESE